jgi:hypothetical protein
LASGEGLIWHVRDDPNIVDKRLLVVESEFARVLKVMSRPNNTLSMVLRDSWDNGTLRTMTKNDPSKATNAHISIIGHITEEELEKEMGEVDVFNGFANRFLWVAAKRSQCLPQGGKLDPVVLNDFITKLKSSLLTARKIETMTRSPEANEYLELDLSNSHFSKPWDAGSNHQSGSTSSSENLDDSGFDRWVSHDHTTSSASSPGPLESLLSICLQAFRSSRRQSLCPEDPEQVEGTA